MHILNSLRPSIPQTSREATPESDLSARLRSLRNGSLSPSPSPVSAPRPQPHTASQSDLSGGEERDPLTNTSDLDDQTLEELLNDLGTGEEWGLDPDDPKDIQTLLDEARGALPRDEVTKARTGGEKEEGGKGEKGEGYLTRGLDMSVFTSEVDEDDEGREKAGAEGGGEAGLDGESREIQDILRRLMDEVNFEKGDEEETSKDDADSSTSKGKETDNPSFSLPSAPSTLPEPASNPDAPSPSRKSIDFETDISARLAALSGLGLNLPSTPSKDPVHPDPLGLPSAPTFKPTDKPVPGLAKNIFLDEEIDSWCIICQDDATVKCLGCDGDLYCAGCWKEGHMGADVGYEERGHKWTKFRKPN